MPGRVRHLSQLAAVGAPKTEVVETVEAKENEGEDTENRSETFSAVMR